MKLSRRLILLVAISIIFSAVLITVTASTIILRRFNEVEDAELANNIDRLNDTVQARLTSISSENGDWANWDDAYAFVQGKKPEFTGVNITENAFAQLGITGIYFFDVSNKLVLTQFVNTADGHFAASPAGLDASLAKNGVLNFSTLPTKQGIIEYQNHDYLLSAQPILTSNGTGPAAGSLIFTRELDANLVSELSQTVHLEVNIYRYGAANLPGDVITARAQLTPNFQPQIHLSSAKTSGYTLVSDLVTKQPILIWRIVMPRTAYNLGRQTVITFLIYFSVIGAVSGSVLVLRLRRTVLARLQRYQKALQQIKTTGDLGVEVEVSGNDEISQVGQSINDLLGRLRNSLAHLTTEKSKDTIILQSMGEGVIVIDEKLKVVAINRAAEQLLEVDAASVVGQLWTEIVNVYDRDQKISIENRSIVKVLKTGQPIYVKVEDGRSFETKSGKRFPVITTTTPFRTALSSGVVVVFRDATQELNTRLKIEAEVADRTKALDEAKARLIASINSLSIGYVMVDVNQSVVLINQAAINLFHRQHDTHSDVNHTNSEELATIPALSQAMGRDIGKEINLALQDKEQHLLDKLTFGSMFINVLISPITQGEGVIGAVILLEDVTNQIALERSKDEFFSIASHELRTPLTTIRGNSGMIQEYYPQIMQNPELKEMVGDIHDSSIRLIGIVNDYLNVSRLEQKRIRFIIEPFDLYQLAVKVVRSLTASAQEKGLTLGLIPLAAGGNAIASGDAARTEEVLINLIGNAIKYTDRGGVTVALESSLSTVKLLVSDTGRGIPPETQSSLFRKFQQAASNIYVRDPSKSTGLGLYISRLLISGMGGIVELVQSVPGQGSVFAFVLPKPVSGQSPQALNESPKPATVGGQ